MWLPIYTNESNAMQILDPPSQRHKTIADIPYADPVFSSGVNLTK